MSINTHIQINYRLAALKSYERDSLNDLEKMIPGQSKKYEQNKFVAANIK